jgi:hypothetical protein
MSASTIVVNPTNAPPRPNQPLPFIQSGKKIEARPKQVDPFNAGKEYADEGAPLLTSDIVTKAYNKPFFARGAGIIDTPSAAEITALSQPDETSQTQIRYLKEAVVMDVDAKLITSTIAQMRQGRFREASYPTLRDYFGSQHYKQLRESRIIVENLVKAADDGEEPDNLVGIKFNPKLARLASTIDNQIIRHLKESKVLPKDFKASRRLREDFFTGAPDVGDTGGVGQILPNWDGGSSFAVGGRSPEFTPLLSGPYNKQLYYFDYLDMHSKAFEAWTHNPVAKRIVKVIRQFVLGKGVKITVMSAEQKTGQGQSNQQTGQQQAIVKDWRARAQEILDRHWVKNSLHIRSKQILGDLIIFGENFVRYFEASWGLKIREIDPSTVWEVVTDPDDCENEFYLHQQYPTKYQWYVDLPVPTIKFIIRQVPSLCYYHMKINATAGEVRGRSELFAILGWLKRLKEFASDRVIRNKMGNLFVLDVAVEGDASAVQAVQAQFNTPPTPGSFFIHNKAAELNGVPAEINSAESTGDWDMLLTIIGMGAGLSQQYLGMNIGSSKAEALVGTEPDVKTFEDYQELMEQFFLQDAQRVFERAQDQGELPRNVPIIVEVTYPALAEENRSEKFKDLAFGESMSWWSHRRVASASAKEMQFTSYDYDQEQEQIAQEDAQKEFLINTAYQQVTKGQDSAAQQPGGGGGTSSGGSGKGASGMGMGKLPGASGSSKSESESVREASPLKEAIPAVAPGTSSASNVSGMAVTHNASVGPNGKRDPWAGRDPRDMADGIKREAANLRYQRRGIGRRQDRVQTPDKVRDQKALHSGNQLTKAKKAMIGGYNESEEGGPGSGPRGRGKFDHPDPVINALAHFQLDHDKGKAKSNEFYAKQHGLNPKQAAHAANAMDYTRKEKESGGITRNGITRFPREAREGFEPFKTQDGEQIQHPRTENFPTEKNAHAVTTGKPNKPRGFGSNKRE